MSLQWMSLQFDLIWFGSSLCGTNWTRIWSVNISKFVDWRQRRRPLLHRNLIAIRYCIWLCCKYHRLLMYISRVFVPQICFVFVVSDYNKVNKYTRDGSNWHNGVIWFLLFLSTLLCHCLNLSGCWYIICLQMFQNKSPVKKCRVSISWYGKCWVSTA